MKIVNKTNLEHSALPGGEFFVKRNFYLAKLFLLNNFCRIHPVRSYRRRMDMFTTILDNVKTISGCPCITFIILSWTPPENFWWLFFAIFVLVVRVTFFIHKHRLTSSTFDKMSFIWNQIQMKMLLFSFFKNQSFWGFAPKDLNLPPFLILTIVRFWAL